MGRTSLYRRTWLSALALCLLLTPRALGTGDAAVPDGGKLVERGSVVIPIQGGMVSRTEVISVVLPVSIPFVVDLAEDGTLRRVLSATGSISNYSRTDVDVAVSQVTDPAGLLKELDLFLAAGAGGTRLSAGTKLALPLAVLPASPDGIAGQSLPLRIDGSAGGALSYNDGDTFNVEMTLKVSKKTA